MKKNYTNIERRGLPGGPNETFIYTTGIFSTDNNFEFPIAKKGKETEDPPKKEKQKVILFKIGGITWKMFKINIKCLMILIMLGYLNG